MNVRGMILINKAKHYAKKWHRGQRDDDGKPYYKHPFKVYKLLKLVTNDVDILCAGILHDVVEDTDVSRGEINSKFNPHIGFLVMEVTKNTIKGKKVFPRLHSREGIMIKFADKLSNISRMNSWSEKRRKKYLDKCKFWRSE